jgi:hypothetical protein
MGGRGSAGGRRIRATEKIRRGRGERRKGTKGERGSPTGDPRPVRPKRRVDEEEQ